MGIRFFCPNGHKLNVKAFQAGKRGICPHCGSSMDIPPTSTRVSTREERRRRKKSRASAERAPSEEQVVELIEEGANRPRINGQSAGNDAPQEIELALASPSPDAISEDVFLDRTHEPPAETAGAAEKREPHRPSAVATPSPLAANDPLIGPPNVVWYVRPASGGQYGPAAPDVLRAWIAEGRVGPDALVWREGWREWQAAGEVLPSLVAPRATTDLVDLAGVDASVAFPAQRPAASRPRRSQGSPLTVMIVLMGIGVGVLLLVFLWVKFAA